VIDVEDVEIYDFLEHRGVKGMHWGVRKASPASRDATPKEVAKGKGVKPKVKSKESMKADAAAGLVGMSAFLLARSRMMSLPVSAVVFAGSATATRAIINKHNDKKLSEIA
jgi:hypothetical protein